MITIIAVSEICVDYIIENINKSASLFTYKFNSFAVFNRLLEYLNIDKSDLKVFIDSIEDLIGEWIEQLKPIFGP